MKGLVLFFLFSAFIQAQIKVSNLKPDKISENLYVFKSSQGEKTHRIYGKDDKVNAYSYNIEEQVDIIVEFNEEPFFVKKFLSKELTSPNEYGLTHSVFKSDISKIVSDFSSKQNKISATYIVKKEFYKVFNGVSLSVSPVLFGTIMNLPYVKKIYLDHRVDINLMESVGVIGADSLWTQYNTRGEGVLVGVIDTGIDYMHPYLGGGFGAGFRVIGGYDFINDDNDPMDDNFHGTHVAGIIGADGDTLGGVAPGVSFLSVKVLDESGSAPSTVVLEGVEYIVDPNGDGSMDDAPDVVNMSLGGPGTPDDPLSQAVDNAVRLGVTFCISAGNAAFNFSIGSPGTSHEAITVGATYKDDVLAEFSSKGPNADYSIKPDVLAPGVRILSTFPDNRVERLSGTSMSSPHVAGLSALLLAVHPEWKPIHVKSALKSSALNLGENVMSQGAGRINALKAAARDAFTYPSDMSFGIAALDEEVWEVEDTLTIYNLSESEKEYTINFENTMAGIEFSTSPVNPIVNSMDSLEVVISLSVDHNQVPFPTDRSVTYGGFALFISDEDTISVPWAFIKAAMLTVTSDLPFPAIHVTSDKYFVSSFDLPIDDVFNFTFTLPADVYDVVTTFSGSDEAPRIVFHENVNVEDVVKLQVNSFDAKNKLIMDGVDEQNRKLNNRQNLLRDIDVLYPAESELLGFGFAEDLNSKEIYANDFSDRFSFLITEYQHDLGTEDRVRILRHKAVKGLTDDFILTNSPDDYLSQKVAYSLPPNQNSSWLFFPYITRFFTVFDDTHVNYGFNAIEHFVSENNWSGEIYITEEEPHNYFGKTSALFVSPDEDYIKTYNWFESPTMQSFDGKFGFYTHYDDLIYFKEPKDVLLFGSTPIYSNSFFINNWYGASNISIRLPTNFGMQFYGALDELRELESSEAQYEIISDNGEVVDAGKLFESEPVNVDPGEYTVNVNNRSFYLNSFEGHTEFQGKFDLNRKDVNPPDILYVRVMNQDSTIVNSVNSGEDAIIEFAVADIEPERTIGQAFRYVYQSMPIDSTKLFYRITGTENWKEMEFRTKQEFVGSGLRYNADWENNLNTDSSAIDIMFTAQDNSGNSIEYKLIPAFLVGDKLVSLDDEETDQLSQPLAFSLSDNYPNPFNPATVINYTIQSKQLVKLRIFNMLGEEMKTLVNSVKTPGSYSTGWDASNLASGVYFYRIEAGNFSQTKKMLLIK